MEDVVTIAPQINAGNSGKISKEEFLEDFKQSVLDAKNGNTNGLSKKSFICHKVSKPQRCN